ncbi:MAG: class I adenylate-forming enzyme family protein [Caulobacteraceae bacterium]|nr:class I adenylate-forming enzyme family protein [Caulobacteraceae bacterium]
MNAPGALHENVRDIVRRVALARPDAEACVLGDQRWSYAELDRRIDALARALVAAGVGHGDRVATLSTPHPDFLVAFLAAGQIGAIWVGLNPRYRPAELGYVLGDAEPKVLLVRTRIEARDYRGDFAALAADCPSLVASVVLNGDPLFDGALAYDAFIAGGAGVDDAALAAAQAKAGGRQACMIVYTSGSTGAPKGALLHHQGVCDFCRAQDRLWPVSPQRVLNYFPINHIGSVIDITLPTLEAGGAVVFLEQFDPAIAMRLTADEGLTLWGSVPSVLQMQLGLPDFADYDLSAVQLILWEGAAVPAEMLDRLLALGPPLATNYGMTETTSAMIAVAPTRDRDILANTVGLPFDGVEIRLAKADGTDAADGEEGEVWARSGYNMLGYWRRPEATAEAITPDGWLRTGDTAIRRADGRYRIVGRIKEMYKSGGYNVYPREVEDVLEAHPAVSLAAVVPIKDPLWAEVGVAYVIAASDATVESLEAHCRERLANYKIPKRFVLRRELPLLPIGKVDKIALKTLARETFEAG